MFTPWKKSYDQPSSNIKKQRHCFANKGPSSQSYSFFRSHVWMWELDYKESWALKNWCFWTVVLEKTLKSPLDCKEIQPVHPKGNKSWIFIGRTDAEAEVPIIWLPDGKNWLIWKNPDAGIDWGQEEKGTTEDEMVGWHHWLDGHEFEQALGVGEVQGSPACCSPSVCIRVRCDWENELNWHLPGSQRASFSLCPDVAEGASKPFGVSQKDLHIFHLEEISQSPTSNTMALEVCKSMCELWGTQTSSP